MRYTIKTNKPKRQYLSNEKQKIAPERKTEEEQNTHKSTGKMTILATDEREKRK